MNLSKVVRPNILALAPYSCARDEFKGEARINVDANENPYNNGLNRYPDPRQLKVKALLAPIKGVKEEQIFLGNGSDEAIDLVYRIFCRPGIDNVVAPAPTYGMYQVCAEVNDVEYRAVPMQAETFALDVEAMAAQVDDHTKVIWVCSPNNPSGNAYSREQLISIVERFHDQIVVIDEAYIDFAAQPSMTDQLDRHDNLIVLQTFSKAWGHAAMRLGIAMSSPAIIAFFNNVKYPYNVNELTQQEAVRVLENVDRMRRQVAEVLSQRDILRQLLEPLPIVQHVYPSDANFLLVKVNDAMATYQYLQSEGVIVRNRHKVQLCANCLRITIGTPEENAQLYNLLKDYGNK
ncbi:MAG: histidinol-phosphate transaminase [Bacteroidales bacterium]|nr:histidinol-phosphate transaminase [Bacteroidales bacterium]